MNSVEKNKLKIELYNKAVEKLQNDLKSIGVNVTIKQTEVKEINMPDYEKTNNFRKQFVIDNIESLFNDIIEYCQDAVHCIDNDEKADAGHSIGKIETTIEFCKHMFDEDE